MIGDVAIANGSTIKPGTVKIGKGRWATFSPALESQVEPYIHDAGTTVLGEIGQRVIGSRT